MFEHVTGVVATRSHGHVVQVKTVSVAAHWCFSTMDLQYVMQPQKNIQNIVVWC